MPDTLTLTGPIDLARLAAPFPPEAISWRVGATNSDKTKGLALAYIDARDVMNRLDEVCGPLGWQDEFTETQRGRVLCRIGILGPAGWVWKGDGAGETDVESEKGAISDALKRAAVHWGVGRYLYDMPATWVAIEQRGKTSVIKDSEQAKLAKVAAGAGPSLADPPPRQRRTNVQINPETGKPRDLENAKNQREEWGRFTDKVQGYVDARDVDGLKAWFNSDRTSEFVAGWVFKDQANEHFEAAVEHIEKMERA